MSAQSLQAGCAACETACPHGALQLAGAGLRLEPGLCSGCGHCAAACPQSALSLPEAPAPVLARHGAQALLACRQAPKAPPDAAPCAQALSLEDLAALWLSGVRVLALATGTCSQCPDAPPEGAGLTARLALLARLCESRSLPGLSVRPLPPDALHSDALRSGALRSGALRSAGRPAASFDGPASPGRRALFAGLMTSNPPRPDPALARLQRRPAPAGQSALYAHAPRIDPDLCTGCDACVKLCPQNALILVKDELSHLCYRIDPAACTGCGLCTDICNSGAIAPPQPGEAPPDVKIYEFTCTGCRATLHHPNPDTAANRLCPACARKGWGRTPVLVL